MELPPDLPPKRLCIVRLSAIGDTCHTVPVVRAFQDAWPDTEITWIIGVLIFVIMMATVFMGYVLPWGQMSFWGATVITNFFSAIPGVGEDVVEWLWGGFAVDNPTLNRFFSLHYLLPFVIVGVVVLHIWALHVHGSNNPIGIDTKGEQDVLPFHPYYTVKDMFGLGVFLIVFALFIFFAPNYMGHPDNYIPANALSTPAHIVPEWYFLPFYAILRAVPDNFIGGWTTEWLGFIIFEAKLAGVLAMFGAIAVLFVLPWLDRCRVKSIRYRGWIYKFALSAFVVSFLTLGWLGLQPAEGIYVLLARLFSGVYFLFFLLMPYYTSIEKTKPVPERVTYHG